MKDKDFTVQAIYQQITDICLDYGCASKPLVDKLTALHQEAIKDAIPKFSDMPEGNADFMEGFRAACLQMEAKLKEADLQQEDSNG